MTDTDKLREAIAAIFAEDDPFVGIGKSSYDKADRVLALAAAPQPAPEQGMTRAEVGQMLDAKRHDREALVEVIREARRKWQASWMALPLDESFDGHIADALLARGLRLPAIETKPRRCAECTCEGGEHECNWIKPGPVRVVEGGDDAV